MTDTETIDSTSIDSDQDDVDADGSTTSTSKRHWLTNDVLAYLLVGTFPAIVILASVDVVDLGAVDDEMLAERYERLREHYRPGWSTTREEGTYILGDHCNAVSHLVG